MSRSKHWCMGAVLFAALVTLSGCQAKAPAADEVSAAGGLSIALDQLSETPQFFDCESDGVAMQVIALKDGDGIARLDGDVQRVTTEIDYGSYPPITVQAGVPVEWTLRVPEGKLTGCNNAIVIPAYGLRVELQTGDNLVAFTPEEPGTVAFSCWMGMIRSTITVVESLAAEAAATPTPEVQGAMPSPAPIAGCCL